MAGGDLRQVSKRASDPEMDFIMVAVVKFSLIRSLSFRQMIGTILAHKSYSFLEQGKVELLVDLKTSTVGPSTRALEDCSLFSGENGHQSYFVLGTADARQYDKEEDVVPSTCVKFLLPCTIRREVSVSISGNDNASAKVMNSCIMSPVDPVEAKNLSAELNESKEINGIEVSDDSKVVLSHSDKSSSGGGQTIVITMADNTGELGGTITKFLSTPGIIELREYNSVVEDRMVFEVSSMGPEHELEKQRVFPPSCDSRGSKYEADSGGEVELKSYTQDLKHYGKCFILT
ncbi:hypothetical protein VNO77_22537 [Canavalia gladiata]|uniref:Uncharacterized protein n=1 Tax=Canavalia gladiata TaxID=3824 RepID=A0AAN9QAN3_CANGL